MNHEIKEEVGCLSDSASTTSSPSVRNFLISNLPLVVYKSKSSK
jgi:hypothetical protein